MMISAYEYLLRNLMLNRRLGKDKAMKDMADIVERLSETGGTDYNLFASLVYGKHFVVPESFSRILSKVTFNVNLIDILKKMAGLSGVFDNYVSYSVTLGSHYSTLVFCEDGFGRLMLEVFYYNLATDSTWSMPVDPGMYDSSINDIFSVLYDNAVESGTSFDDRGDEVQVCRQYTNLLFRVLFYVACNGQPDLRLLVPKKEFNNPKKLKRLKKYDQPIIPTTVVGLSYAKDPLYRTGQWERRGHFRNQPYGPKDNPTHYELIWIDRSTVTRKSGMVIEDIDGI